MRIRKTILLLFLAGIVCSPMLIPAILEIQTVMLKAEARERIETDFLQTVYMGEADIKWSDPGSEMIINGEMFDLLEISQTVDGILVTGVFDTKETVIQNELNRMGPGENGQQKGMLLEYFRWFNNFYFRHREQVPKLFITCTVKHLPECPPAGIRGFIKIPSPPPKV